MYVLIYPVVLYSNYNSSYRADSAKSILNAFSYADYWKAKLDEIFLKWILDVWIPQLSVFGLVPSVYSYKSSVSECSPSESDFDSSKNSA